MHNHNSFWSQKIKKLGFSAPNICQRLPMGCQLSKKRTRPSLKNFCHICLFTASLVLSIFFCSPPIQAQIPFFSDFQETIKAHFSSEDPLVSECIRLDGRCLFKIAEQQSNIATRVESVEERLQNLAESYFQGNNLPLSITKRAAGSLWNIYVTIDNNETRLLTVTIWDAQITAVTVEARADQIIERLDFAFTEGKQEREGGFLISQGVTSLAIVVIVVLTNFIILKRLKHFEELKKELRQTDNVQTEITATELTNRQKFNVTEVIYRFLQLSQFLLWSGAIWFILGLFPHSRWVRFLLVSWLKIPLRLGLLILLTYIAIRLSYALINYFTYAIISNDLLNPGIGQRVILRISTISGVVKSIVTIILIITAGIVALLLGGINVAPLIAGIGILGVGVSLASQQLIKDMINGFLIILEDQYAVGDMIEVGGVEGIVQTINLRITQVRDPEGKLITIPNSEVKIVANYSNQWSRADLKIPVGYQTDLEKALEIIEQVAQQLEEDLDWKDKICQTPEILGVDDFARQGVIIRVWIKTAPLEQLKVGREFRRRIKIAFDRYGIFLCLPQQIYLKGDQLLGSRDVFKPPSLPEKEN